MNDFNSTVIYDNPDDVVYLYRLAKEQPLTYVEFALSSTRLQDYVDDLSEFN